MVHHAWLVAVGGGTAGSVLASRLAEDANRTILVLEAGGFPTVDSDIEVPILADIVRNNDQFNWRYTTVPQKHACKAHVDQVRNRVLSAVGDKLMNSAVTVTLYSSLHA